MVYHHFIGCDGSIRSQPLARSMLFDVPDLSRSMWCGESFHSISAADQTKSDPFPNFEGPIVHDLAKCAISVPCISSVRNSERESNANAEMNVIPFPDFSINLCCLSWPRSNVQRFTKGESLNERNVNTAITRTLACLTCTSEK